MKKIFMGIIIGLLTMVSAFVFADEGLEKIEAYLRPTLPITLNGEQVTLESSPVMYDGSTYLKLRDVAKITGVEVNWNDKTQTVELSNSPKGGKSLSNVNIQDDYTGPVESTYNGVRSVSVNGETYFSLRDYSDKNEPFGWGLDQANNTLYYAEYKKGSGEIVRKISEVSRDEANAFLIHNGESYLNIRYYPQS